MGLVDGPYPVMPPVVHVRWRLAITTKPRRCADAGPHQHTAPTRTTRTPDRAGRDRLGCPRARRTRHPRTDHPANALFHVKRKLLDRPPDHVGVPTTGRRDLRWPSPGNARPQRTPTGIAGRGPRSSGRCPCTNHPATMPFHVKRKLVGRTSDQVRGTDDERPTADRQPAGTTGSEDDADQAPWSCHRRSRHPMPANRPPATPRRAEPRRGSHERRAEACRSATSQAPPRPPDPFPGSTAPPGRRPAATTAPHRLGSSSATFEERFTHNHLGMGRPMPSAPAQSRPPGRVVAGSEFGPGSRTGVQWQHPVLRRHGGWHRVDAVRAFPPDGEWPSIIGRGITADGPTQVAVCRTVRVSTERGRGHLDRTTHAARRTNRVLGCRQRWVAPVPPGARTTAATGPGANRSSDHATSVGTIPDDATSPRGTWRAGRRRRWVRSPPDGAEPRRLICGLGRRARTAQRHGRVAKRRTEAGRGGPLLARGIDISTASNRRRPASGRRGRGATPTPPRGPRPGRPTRSRHHPRPRTAGSGRGVPAWSNRHPRERVPAAPWAPAGATSGAPREVEDPRPLDAADRLARARRGAGGVHGGRRAQCSSRQGHDDASFAGQVPSTSATSSDGDGRPETRARRGRRPTPTARRTWMATRHPTPPRRSRPWAGPTRDATHGPDQGVSGRSRPPRGGQGPATPVTDRHYGVGRGARVRTADASPGDRRGEATAPRPGRVGADARGVRDVHRRRPSHRRGRNPGPRDPRPANGRRWAQAAR